MSTRGQKINYPQRKLHALARLVLIEMVQRDATVPLLAALLRSDNVSIYHAIAPMKRRGWVVRLPEKKSLASNRPSFVYSITDAGRESLAAGDVDDGAPVPVVKRRTKAGSGQIAGKTYYRGLNWSASMQG